MSTFRLSIKSPEKQLFDGDVNSLSVRTDMGIIKILPKHTSLLSSISASLAEVVSGDLVQRFFIRSGTVAVDQTTNVVSVQAFECHKEEEFTATTLAGYLDMLQARLGSGVSLGDFEVKFLHQELSSVAQGLKITNK